MAIDINDMLTRAKETDSFWVESEILDITERISDLMERHGVSKSELANRLGRSPAFVTKLMRGNNNFTLETLVKVGRRLGCNYHGYFQPYGTTSGWIEFLHEKPVISAIQPAAIEPGYRWEWQFQTSVEFHPISEKNEALSTRP